MQTFDLTAIIPGHTASIHTQRAYFRWIDQYLVELAGLKPTQSDSRLRRMSRLPVKTLQRHLTPRKLRRWLDALAEAGHGRQSLDQARAAIVTVSDLASTAGVIPSDQARAMRDISVPAVARKHEPERLLTPSQLKSIMSASRDMARTNNQMLRNNVVTLILCTMALRREELSRVKWGDLRLIDGKAVLQLSPHSVVEMPRPVLIAIDRWRTAIGGGDAIAPVSPLIRRIWKGGRIGKEGLSPDGIWLIVRNSAIHAGLGHVTPDDLRRSAAAGLRDAGVPVDQISRLLRHRNIAITERFLARLPRVPER